MAGAIQMYINEVCSNLINSAAVDVMAAALGVSHAPAAAGALP